MPKIEFFDVDTGETYSEEDAGVCTECGCIYPQVDLDARGVKCEACGQLAVYSIKQLLIGVE